MKLDKYINEVLDGAKDDLLTKADDLESKAKNNRNSVGLIDGDCHSTRRVRHRLQGRCLSQGIGHGICVERQG